jgi:hypothetical protein
LRVLWHAMQFSTNIGATSRMKLTGLPGLLAAALAGLEPAGFFGSDGASRSRFLPAVFEGADSFVAFFWLSSPRAGKNESTPKATNAEKQQENVRDIVEDLQERRLRGTASH